MPLSPSLVLLLRTGPASNASALCFGGEGTKKFEGQSQTTFAGAPIRRRDVDAEARAGGDAAGEERDALTGGGALQGRIAMTVR
jgi:hypothetical protein